MMISKKKRFSALNFNQMQYYDSSVNENKNSFENAGQLRWWDFNLLPYLIPKGNHFTKIKLTFF